MGRLAGGIAAESSGAGKLLVAAPSTVAMVLKATWRLRSPTSSSWHPRPERSRLVVACTDDSARRLGHFIPNARDVAERLGDDHPCVL